MTQIKLTKEELDKYLEKSYQDGYDKGFRMGKLEGKMEVWKKNIDKSKRGLRK